MKLNSLILTAAAVVATASVSTAGDISGKISLKGTPPPEKEIPLDPMCGKLHPDTKPTTRFFVTQGGGLGDVFVVLKNVSGKSAGASAPASLIDQKGCEYLPYVSAVQTGQKIAVRTSDPVLHNVHPTPAVAGNQEKNQAMVPGSPDLNFVFEKPEMFLRFKCDVHPWMFAYVSVVDHPYFAVSKPDGSFTIKNVPDGKYTVEIKHRKGAPEGQTKDIEVKGGNVSGVDFTIELK